MIGTMLETRETKENIEKPKVGLSLQNVLFPKETNREIILNRLSGDILGVNLQQMKIMAKDVLKPYRNNGEKKKHLLIGGASPSSALQEIERQMLKEKGCILDIPGGIETRDTCLSTAGDIALIATSAGLKMADKKENIKVLDLANEVVHNSPAGEIFGKDMYYKSDALLLLIMNNPKSDILTQLREELKSNPLISPYNLDEETQIALLWLAKEGGINRLDVHANSPEVAVELTRKGYRYPTVEMSAKLKDHPNPYLMQKNEWELSPMAKETGFHPDYVPGYAINRSDNYEDFCNKFRLASELMSKRYDLHEFWVKPDRGTDGGNQGSISIMKPDFHEKIQELWEKKVVEAWVVEAKTNYFTIELPINNKTRKILTAPSVHVVQGKACDTIALQMVDGLAWGGNLICSQSTWSKMIDMVDASDQRIKNNPRLTDQLQSSYNNMVGVMQKYVRAVNSSEKYRNGQVRGGTDLALATIGGRFGDEIMVVFQDNNPRANGGEAARSLYKQAQEKYGEGKGEAITRIITPNVSLDDYCSRLNSAIMKTNWKYDTQISPDQVKLISYSAGVGIIGLIGTDALAITKEMFMLEDELRQMKIIK